MNNKERLLIALDRGQPDTVPIWELAFNESSIIGIAKHFVDEKNLPESKLVMHMTDLEKFQIIGGLVGFAKELDLDGVTAIGLPSREAIDESHMRDAFGAWRAIPGGRPHQGSIGPKELQDAQATGIRLPDAKCLERRVAG